MHNTKKSNYKKAFTLVEMLIVIVIIGILAIALIPRIVDTQARARDAARDADIRTLANAVDLYHVDNGGYPAPVLSATVDHIATISDIFLPTVYANTPGSTIDSLSGSVSKYLSSIPRDPKGIGVKAVGSTCINAGNSYAYNSNGSTYYAITSIAESKKGNAATCGDTIDRDNNGGYKKVGVGLEIDFSPLATAESCFGFSNNTITSYDDNCPRDVVIPRRISGSTVSIIGESVFWGKGITSVYIPNSVVRIKRAAFLQNSISSLILGNQLQVIEESAFQYNPISSLIIPNSVHTIGGWAFLGNKIQTLQLGTNVKNIDSAAFRDNEIRSLIIPDSVTNIGDVAFAGNKIQTLVIGNGLRSMLHGTFAYNELENLEIPNTVQYIGNDTFVHNKLTNVTIPVSITSFGGRSFLNNGPNRNSNNIEGRPNATTAHGTRILPAGSTTWVKQ